MRLIFKHSLVFYIVKNFVSIILVLLAAIFMQSSSLVALILVQCAHILTRCIEDIFFWYREDYINVLPGVPSGVGALDGEEKKKRTRSFVILVIYKVVGVLLLWLLGKVDSELFGVISNIVSFVIIIRMAMPKTHKKMNADKKNCLIITRDDALYAIFTRIVSKKEKALYKILTFFSRLLIIVGFALNIFLSMSLNQVDDSAKSYKYIAIVGCILWALRMALAIYVLCVDYELRALCGDDDYDSDNEYESYDTSNSGASNGENAINASEVKRIVQRIADRWSYKDDRSLMVNDASIRFSVSVEVLYDEIIEYTVAGKISCKDDNASSAFTFLSDKVEKAANKIQFETQSELQKYNLKHPYEIRVNIGGVTRD